MAATSLIVGAWILSEPQRHRDTEEAKGRWTVLGASRQILPSSVKDLCASVSLWSIETGAEQNFEPRRHGDTEVVKGRFTVLGASRQILPFSVKDLCASVSLWSI